jgi:hypothetical protein
MSATDTPPAGSISFAITTVYPEEFSRKLRDIVGSVLQPGDELIMMMRSRHAAAFTERPPWLRVVDLPEASIYRLRNHVPAVCRCPWIVLLEDHAMITPETVAAIRALIARRDDIDLVPFLTKNLTTQHPWEWAVFLHTFASTWAPVDRPPPIATVTSTIVRRAALPAEPLRDGEWELFAIPRLFAGGRWTYSNDIFIDHVKPGQAEEAISVVFHNARSGASNQLSLGFSRRAVAREAWYVFARHAGRQMRAVASRRHELPRSIRLRLHAIGFVHMLGNLAALLFGPGRSAYKLD